MEITLQIALLCTTSQPQCGPRGKRVTAQTERCMDTQTYFQPIACHFPGRETAGRGLAAIQPPVNSWRQSEDDKKASQTPLGYSSLELKARLHGCDCHFGRCLQGGYELPYSVAASWGVLGFGWLQAFCGISLLSEWHLLEGPKNTEDFFLQGSHSTQALRTISS